MTLVLVVVFVVVVNSRTPCTGINTGARFPMNLDTDPDEQMVVDKERAPLARNEPLEAQHVCPCRQFGTRTAHNRGLSIRETHNTEFVGVGEPNTRSESLSKHKVKRITR